MAIGSEIGLQRNELDPSIDLGNMGIAEIGSSNAPTRSLSNSNRIHNARFNEEEIQVQVTLGIQGDSVSIQNITGRESEMKMLGSLMSRLEKRTSSIGSQLSLRFKQLLKQLTSSSRFSKFDRSDSAAARAIKGLQLVTRGMATNKKWPDVEIEFNKLAVDGVLDKSHFGQCIGIIQKDKSGKIRSDEFASVLFDGLARRRGISSPTITKDQLKDFWKQLDNKDFDARLQTFFDMVDTNADGSITKDEVKEIIALSASANKLSNIKDGADEYAALFMEELDPDKLGYIKLHNLQMLLQEASTNSDISQRLSQELVLTIEPNPIKRWCRKLAYFLNDNKKRLWVIALWLSICALLFTWKFIQYKNHQAFEVMGYCLTTAKGAAETLKFNMALILLPVCRNTITWLRSRTDLGVVVPFNDNINFHKVIALGIAIGVGLHAGAHLTCDFPRVLHATDDEYEPMKPFFGEDRPPNYWWFLRGTEGWTGLVMVVLMAIAFTWAQPWFRKGKLKLSKPFNKLTGFNAFWYLHHLFIIVYVLFVIHGIFLYLSQKWYKKTTWMYLAIPIILYTCERLNRTFRSRRKIVNILKVIIYPGDVVALHVSKPQGYKYRSGQYIFVNCPSISSFQWHPFSITSAPGDDYLSIHIRNAGDWTSQLKTVFSKVCEPGELSGVLSVDTTQDKNIRFPRLSIDGPYGAPAQDYLKYDVLLLIGLGIGATPMISIMKDVLNNIKQRDLEEGVIENGEAAKKKKPFATSRAYFYWVTPSADSFEWFKEVLNEVTENDQTGLIELHNHCTSVHKEGDPRSALIAMLQSFHHAKNNVDIVSDTRVKTHFGRPNWPKVFQSMVKTHPNKRVGVFYCGHPGSINELKRLAKDFSRNTNTKFDFHKENF